MDVNDTISRSALLAAYDAAHKGPPGGARKLIENAKPVAIPGVTYCKDCRYCYTLSETDPLTAYDGSGDGSFYCNKNDWEYYAPRYTADRYYCADGKPRVKTSKEG